MADKNQAFPDVVEVGEQVPAGANVQLGKRFLFMMDHYQGRRPFHLPVFIEDYVATSWLPASSNTEVAGGLTPIYEDDQFMAFDRDVAGAEIFGLTWPDEYDRFKRPRPVF